MAGTPIVQVATVAPGLEPWRSETVRLFVSLRACGGGLSGTKAVCYFDRLVDRHILSELHALGVVTRLIAPVDKRCAMGNNLMMLDDDGADYVVALDCDIVIAADFSKYLFADAVGLTPVDVALAPIYEWERFYTYFGVTLPKATAARSTGEPSPGYFNAGTLIVPQALVGPLRIAWSRWIGVLADAFDGRRIPGALGEKSAYTDQLALALALQDDQIPHRILPLAMQTPTHCKIDPTLRPEEVDPLILHYHHRVDEVGCLLPTGYRSIDRTIGRVNRALRAGRQATSVAGI